MKVGPEVSACSETPNTRSRTAEACFAQELPFATQILPSPDFPAPRCASDSRGCCSSAAVCLLSSCCQAQMELLKLPPFPLPAQWHGRNVYSLSTCSHLVVLQSFACFWVCKWAKESGRVFKRRKRGKKSTVGPEKLIPLGSQIKNKWKHTTAIKFYSKFKLVLNLSRILFSFIIFLVFSRTQVTQF